MEWKEELLHYATSYGIRTCDLYHRVKYKRYLPFATRDNKNYCREVMGRILRYFFYLLIQDIIENNVTFKFPEKCYSWIEMTPVSGKDFVNARQNGAFKDVDFLMSNFTGYVIYLRRTTKYSTRRTRLYVSHRYKDRITELTNQGKGW